MDRDVLRNPDAAVSAAWKALVHLFGPEVQDWEPDTLHIELRRRGVTPTTELMGKLLAAQTVVTTREWCSNYEVLFAIALACDGVPVEAGFPQHPTPEQLAWAVNECSALSGLKLVDLENHGFDPDEIDPAVACVLIDDGWHVAPKELSFVDDVMERMTFVDDGEATYPEIVALRDAASSMSLVDLDRAARDAGETAAGVQLTRLLDLRRYIEGRETARAAQYDQATR
jgi:hypothetical protein